MFPSTAAQYPKRKQVETSLNQGSLKQGTNSTDELSVLRKAFQEDDPEGRRVMSFQEISKVLGGRIGASFDTDLLLQLFTQAGKRQEDSIPSEDFIQTYLQAEKRIWEQLHQVTEQLTDTTNHITETRAKLALAEESETINSSGIMEGSTLTVSVLEAQDLKPMDQEGSADPYALLLCEGQRIETKYHKNTLNPIWKETFTFQIKTGQDDLKVMVMDHDALGTDNIAGQANIPLDALKDQMEHEDWFDLQDKSGLREQGRIKLKLQWIWSKKTYLSTVLGQWQVYMDDDLKASEELKLLLRKLREPFRPQTRGTAVLEKILTSTQVKAMDEVLSSRIDKVTASALGRPVNWSTACLITTIIFLLLTIFSMFLRPDFLNLTLGVWGYYLSVLKVKSQVTYRLLALVVLLSQVLDCVWLGFFGLDWTVGLQVEERNMRRVCLLTTLLNFIYKFCLVGVYYKEGVELGKAAEQ